MGRILGGVGFFGSVLAIIMVAFVGIAGLAGLILLAYFVGSVSAGRLIWKATERAGPDPQRIGSGSFGATNMLRTGSKWKALLTLMGDAGKGAAMVWLGFQIPELLYSSPIQRSLPKPSSTAMAISALPYLAGLASIFGHCYPFPWRSPGGKGVATFMGCWIALNPAVASLIILTWLSVATWKHYSSLASLISTASTPLWIVLLGAWTTTTTSPTATPLWLAVAMAIAGAGIVWQRHQGNIKRLQQGTENKIGRPPLSSSGPSTATTSRKDNSR